jgi:hypothetical protein
MVPLTLANALQRELCRASRAIEFVVPLLGGFAMRDAYAQLSIGMVWGVAIGAGLGQALFDNMAMGVAVGIAVGAGIAGVLFAANDD